MYINPGELNKKIEIVEVGRLGESGFRDEDVVVRTCCAKVTNKTGKERNAVDTGVNESYTRFLIRYTKQLLTTKMKIRYRSSVYDIQDINDLNEEHRYLELYCKKGEI